MSIYVVPLSSNAPTVLYKWPEDMDMLWIKFLSFVSVFCFANLSCFMIVHIFKDQHKVAGDINSLNLLVWFGSLRPSQQLWSCRDGQFT